MPPHRPCVLVVHERAFVRQAIARALRAESPALAVRKVLPDRLDAALRALPIDSRPIVVAARAPSRGRVRGWVALADAGAGDVVGAVLALTDDPPGRNEGPAQAPAAAEPTAVP